MRAGERLVFHISQCEGEADAHMRITYEEARELFDALSVLCEESEVSETLSYVRELLSYVLECNSLPF